MAASERLRRGPTGVDRMARRAPRRPERARRRLPVVPATLRRPLRRRRVPEGPRTRRRAPALGHAARRSRSRRVDARPSRALRRGDARRGHRRRHVRRHLRRPPRARRRTGVVGIAFLRPRRSRGARRGDHSLDSRRASALERDADIRSRDVHPSSARGPLRDEARRARRGAVRVGSTPRRPDGQGVRRARAGTSPALDG